MPRRLAALGERCAGHVVGDQDGGGFEVFDGGHLAGHVEVHDVAAVVAIEAENASAAVDGVHAFKHEIDAGRGKDLADGAGIEQAAADIAGEDGQMARAAAGDDADLAFDGRVGADDDAALRADALVGLRMGGGQAFQHLADVVDWIVEELFHESPFEGLQMKIEHRRVIDQRRFDV